MLKKTRNRAVSLYMAGLRGEKLWIKKKCFMKKSKMNMSGIWRGWKKTIQKDLFHGQTNLPTYKRYMII